MALNLSKTLRQERCHVLIARVAWTVILLVSGFLVAYGATTPTPAAQSRAVSKFSQQPEMESLDGFLDTHPGVAAALHSKPSLIGDKTFLTRNRDFALFLKAHPALAQSIADRPDVVRNREQRFAFAGAVGANPKIKRVTINWFDHYLKAHPDVQSTLRSDPSKIDSTSLDMAHPDLGQFLNNNPGFTANFKKQPSVFLNRPNFFAQPRTIAKKAK
jgi:hypothetical protein